MPVNILVYTNYLKRNPMEILLESITVFSKESNDICNQLQNVSETDETTTYDSNDNQHSAGMQTSY